MEINSQKAPYRSRLTSQQKEYLLQANRIFCKNPQLQNQSL